MHSYNWSRFQLRIPVNAPAASIYRAWHTPQGLESWFLRRADFTRTDGSPRLAQEGLQIGDSYTWLWHGWPDDVTEHGVILQEDGKSLLKFSFGKAGNVTIHIRDEEGIPIVDLLQDEIPADEHSQVHYHIGCMKGWLFYLTNLKSILEGGIDLRNRRLELTDLINS